MNTRRAFLVGSVSAVTAFAGCSSSTSPTVSQSTSLGATSSPTTNEKVPPSAVKTTTETETTKVSTAATSEETTVDEHLVNLSSYPVAWEWDLSTPALGDDLDPRTELLTTDDWHESLDDSTLSEESRSFLSETEFDAESVVAYQAVVRDALNWLVLHSVDGVGTTTVSLSVEERESESGVNVLVTLLLLVRVPNRSTEPNEVNVTRVGRTTAG